MQFNGKKIDGFVKPDRSGTTADKIIYDNTTSGMAAENVQDAIDELNTDIENAETTINNLNNNKANKDLSNVTYPANTAGSTTTGSGDRVIETYISSDGKTWYRKWASGWKECGISNRGGSWSYHTVTLPLTFSNTNYVVLTQISNNTSTGDILAQTIGVDTKTTTSFKAYYDDNLSKDFYICGY